MIKIYELCRNVRLQGETTVPSVHFPPVYELVIVLAAYWRQRDDLRFVMRRAGLDPADYDLNGMAKSFWAAAIEKAWGRNELEVLLAAIEYEYPKGGFTPRGGPSDPGAATFGRVFTSQSPQHAGGLLSAR